ncbi:ribosomal protein S27AE [Microbacterium marinum]|uniref:Ribosomal protein S27AE n=1 Tax=Microbacterium marinum TaxID=421115 RepID=A0A7W7FJ16_9MICO|nr:hypothetical protein [Microbacterium marinum]MBB4666965.1 ribosomal protein S27AE [Microbacterium marinum]
MIPSDGFEAGEQPSCERCGTVMRESDGEYVCGYCGWSLEVPWVERPSAGDDLPGVGG